MISVQSTDALHPRREHLPSPLGRGTEGEGSFIQYTYDGLNRLVQAERGTLNGSMTDPTRDQQWTLDQVGNWKVMELSEDTGGGMTTIHDWSFAQNPSGQLGQRDHRVGQHLEQRLSRT